MITVDTHIIIWEALSREKLSEKALTAFDQANHSDGIIISDISLWEISMLIEKKRVILEAPYLEFVTLLLKTRNYIIQPITTEIAHLSATLCRGIDGDPADRLIAATAISTNTHLITADRKIHQSKIVRTIW